MLTFDGHIVYFDLDDTLILWDNEDKDKAQEVRHFTLEWDGKKRVQELGIHTVHVDEIKRYKFRGHTVVVWSQGGGIWAEKIVKELGLEDHVDLCISKPTWIYDNWNPRSWMPQPIYKSPSGEVDKSNPMALLQEDSEDESD